MLYLMKWVGKLAICALISTALLSVVQAQATTKKAGSLSKDLAEIYAITIKSALEDYRQGAKPKKREVLFVIDDVNHKNTSVQKETFALIKQTPYFTIKPHPYMREYVRKYQYEPDALPENQTVVMAQIFNAEEDMTKAYVSITLRRGKAYAYQPAYDLIERNQHWHIKNKRTHMSPDSCILKGRSGKHTYQVQIAKVPFMPWKHRIVLKKPKTEHEEPSVKIDGRYIYGSFLVPYDEVVKFEVSVDGVPWRVPKSLWRDLSYLHLETIEPGRLKKPVRKAKHSLPPKNKEDIFKKYYYSDDLPEIWLSRNGKSLQILLGGADGHYGYHVLIRLHKDGRSSRIIIDGEP